MTSATVLPTNNLASGFWAASVRNGYDPQHVWMLASRAVARAFALTPAEVRDLLDGDAGRLLADDIGFIDGGPLDARDIEMLLEARLQHIGWQRLYAQAIRQVRQRPQPQFPF